MSGIIIFFNPLQFANKSSGIDFIHVQFAKHPAKLVEFLQSLNNSFGISPVKLVQPQNVFFKLISEQPLNKFFGILPSKDLQFSKERSLHFINEFFVGSGIGPFKLIQFLKSIPIPLSTTVPSFFKTFPHCIIFVIFSLLPSLV